MRNYLYGIIRPLSHHSQHYQIILSSDTAITRRKTQKEHRAREPERTSKKFSKIYLPFSGNSRTTNLILRSWNVGICFFSESHINFCCCCFCRKSWCLLLFWLHRLLFVLNHCFLKFCNNRFDLSPKIWNTEVAELKSGIYFSAKRLKTKA